MIKWEYLNVASLGANMTKLGLEGWEMVAVEGATMHFKRPIEEPIPEAAPKRKAAAVEPEAA